MTKNGIELGRNDIIETEWKQKSHSKVRINAEKKIMYSGRKKQKGNISYISLTGLKIYIWRKKINFYWEFMKVDWYTPI